MGRKPGILLAADWGKDSKKRAVYKADVTRRSIEKVDSASWSLERLLTAARRELKSGNGPVIISLDLVLGVSAPYFQQVQRVDRWKHLDSFIDWLSLLDSETTFWQDVMKSADWSVEQPFFSVPGGEGSLKEFYDKAGYELRRRIDIRCHSKCPFIVSGIPGTVGSGTRCLWQELAPLVGRKDRDFKIWPFEGRMNQLLEDHDIIIAENYPGISYTSALSPSLPSRRLIVAKTKIESRKKALDQLKIAKWVADRSVVLPELGPALSSEDDFDALMTAAGQMRCVLEGRKLEDLKMDDPVAEGGMLLSSAVDFEPTATKLKVNGDKKRPLKHRRTKKTKSNPKNRHCPIPDCEKVFVKTRRGWDSHVGSLTQHPDWHPNISDPEARRRFFKDEFSEFFQ